VVGQTPDTPETSPTKVSAQFFVINYGLKPISMNGFGFVINYGLNSVAWFAFCLRHLWAKACSILMLGLTEVPSFCNRRDVMI